jgi:hypothetical protein
VTFASTPRLTATRKRALNKLDLYIGEANMMLEIVTDRVEPGECISAQELIAALIRRDEELGGNFLIRMPLGAEDERKVVLLTQSGMYCMGCIRIQESSFLPAMQPRNWQRGSGLGLFRDGAMVFLIELALHPFQVRI